MRHDVSRRELLKCTLLAGALPTALATISTDAQAAKLTPLDPMEPAAKTFSFVTDAANVDAGANPTFKAGQRCATCSQYQGEPTEETAGCKIFAGRSVPAGGWCKVWIQRSG